MSEFNEVPAQNPPETGESISFNHPDKGRFQDPKAQTRIEREENWGNYFAEGVQKIAEGQDPNSVILDWAKNVTNLEDTGSKKAVMLDAATDELLTDEKTGTGNERKFLQDLAAALYQQNAGLLMLDLDGFKQVNDTLGHEAGDEAIVWFNKVIQSKLRSGNSKKGPIRTPDEIYHLHGDEHAVLIYDTTNEGLIKAAERIRKALEEETFEFEGQQRKLTTSIGGTMLNRDEGITGNKKFSDIALYRAKTMGKNRTEVYIPDTKVA